MTIAAYAYHNVPSSKISCPYLVLRILKNVLHWSLIQTLDHNAFETIDPGHNLNIYLHIPMMLHTKYCSISIVGCWEKYFLKFFLKSPFRLSNSPSPWRINCIWTNKNHLFPKSPCLVSFSSPVLQLIKKKFTYGPQVMAIVQMILGSSWSWLYGCWIYNYKMLMYLCNQCLSPLMLWVRTQFMVRCTLYNIMW